MESCAPACWMHVYLSPGWGLGHTEPLCHLFEPVFPGGSQLYSAQCFVSDSIVGARLTRKRGWPREERLGKIENRKGERERESGKNSLRSELAEMDQSAPWSPAAFVQQSAPVSSDSSLEASPNVYSATWTYSNQQTIHCHQYFQTTLAFHPCLLCASLQAKIDTWTNCRTLLTVTFVLNFLSRSQVLSFHNLGEAITEHMPTYDREAINVHCKLPQYDLVL